MKAKYSKPQTKRMKRAKGGSATRKLPKKSKPKFKDNPEDRFGKYRRQEA